MGKEIRQRFNLSIVDGSNIEFFLKGIKPIDLSGIDSLPIKIDDWVVKRYLRQPLGKILEYQIVTNAMGSNAYSYTENIPGYGTTRLEVEPITKVLQSEDTGFVYAISRFIGGNRGKDDKIPELTGLLDQFSADMKRRLGYRGIHIIASNTKLKSGFFPFSGSTCNITDVCTSISDLATASW